MPDGYDHLVNVHPLPTGCDAAPQAAHGATEAGSDQSHNQSRCDHPTCARNTVRGQNKGWR